MTARQPRSHRPRQREHPTPSPRGDSAGGDVRGSEGCAGIRLIGVGRPLSGISVLFLHALYQMSHWEPSSQGAKGKPAWTKTSSRVASPHLRQGFAERYRGGEGWFAWLAWVQYLSLPYHLCNSRNHGTVRRSHGSTQSRESVPSHLETNYRPRRSAARSTRSLARIFFFFGWSFSITRSTTPLETRLRF